MRSTEILRAEHNAVLVVLDQLERAVAVAERGVPVPKDIFTEVGEFFTIFVEKCHNGKEESAVFSQLDDGDRPLTKQLTDEHTAGRQLTRSFSDAVAAYVPGDIASAQRLAETARAYGQMLRRHIEEENTELFPAMEVSLTGSDDRIADEFDRIELEEIGEGTHERLHGMIDSLPARIEPWVAARAGSA